MIALLLAAILAPDVSDSDRQQCNDKVTEHYEQEYGDKSDPVEEKDNSVTVVGTKW